MSVVGGGLGVGNTGYGADRALTFGAVAAGGLGLRVPTVVEEFFVKVIDLVVCVTRSVELTVER